MTNMRYCLGVFFGCGRTWGKYVLKHISKDFQILKLRARNTHVISCHKMSDLSIRAGERERSPRATTMPMVMLPTMKMMRMTTMLLTMILHLKVMMIMMMVIKMMMKIASVKQHPGLTKHV